MTIKRLLACLLYILTISEVMGQIEWPQNKLAAKWDFNQDGLVDVVSGLEMVYDKRQKSRTGSDMESDKHCFDTLPNGRRALKAHNFETPLFLAWANNIDESKKILPEVLKKFATKEFKYAILTDTFTIVLKYSLAASKNKRDNSTDSTIRIYETELFDSPLVSERDINSTYDYNPIIKAHKGMIKVEGWMDTTCTKPAKYEIPIAVDKTDGTVWLMYSFIPVAHGKYGNVIFMEEIATQEGIYRCYKKNTSGRKGGFGILKYLQFRLPYFVKMTDLAIYTRHISIDEFKQLTGKDNIAEYEPEYDHSTYGVLWVVPAGVMLLLCINLSVRFRKKNKPYNWKGLFPVANSRNIALAELEQAWMAFGTRQEPFYPKSKSELKSAQKHLDAAVESGCDDHDVVTQINEVGSLLNHCCSLYYYPKLPVTLTVLFAGFVCIGPIFTRMVEYSLTTHEFHVYYLTITSIMLCGLTPRYIAMCGQPIPKAQHVMGSLGRSCVEVIQGVAQGIWASIMGAIMSVLGVIWMALSIFFGCITEYVVVCGGTIIATGVSGFGIGLLMVALFGVLLGMAIPIIYNFMISVLIIVFPIYCYIYCQYVRKREN